MDHSQTAGQAHAFCPAARNARVVPEPCPFKLRGRREDRASDAPAASYAKVESIRVSHHRFTGLIRPSLHNGFNGLFRALPGEPGLLSPSPRNAFALSRVDASVGASGPHDFAVRFLRRSSSGAKTSTASRPTFVTMANAPLLRRDRRSPRRDLPDVTSKLRATRWHDGQITCRAQSIVNRNPLVSRTRCGV